MSTKVLELGQYVPLPKFCAIWGKMSMGHFVFLGKLSPSQVFILKEHRKKNLKNIFSTGKLSLDFSFGIQSYLSVQKAHRSPNTLQ